MKYQIDVVTRLQDNGDGGYTMYVYNNVEKMLADHHLAVNGKVSDKNRHKILTEDDPHENGYLGKSVIDVEIVDGKAQLTKSLSFHTGQ